MKHFTPCPFFVCSIVSSEYHASNFEKIVRKYCLSSLISNETMNLENDRPHTQRGREKRGRERREGKREEREREEWEREEREREEYVCVCVSVSVCVCVSLR